METKPKPVVENTPKTRVCKNCGKKPKRQILGFGYTDKDDEFYLIHYCKGVFVRFPETNTFTAYYVPRQELEIVKLWNEKMGVSL